MGAYTACLVVLWQLSFICHLVFMSSTQSWLHAFGWLFLQHKLLQHALRSGLSGMRHAALLNESWWYSMLLRK